MLTIRGEVIFWFLIIILLIGIHEAGADGFQRVFVGDVPRGTVKAGQDTLFTDDDLTALGGLAVGDSLDIRGYSDHIGYSLVCVVKSVTSTYAWISEAWPYATIANAMILKRNDKVNIYDNSKLSVLQVISDSLFINGAIEMSNDGILTLNSTKDFTAKGESSTYINFKSADPDYSGIWGRLKGVQRANDTSPDLNLVLSLADYAGHTLYDRVAFDGKYGNVGIGYIYPSSSFKLGVYGDIAASMRYLPGLGDSTVVLRYDEIRFYANSDSVAVGFDGTTLTTDKAIAVTDSLVVSGPLGYQRRTYLNIDADRQLSAAESGSFFSVTDISGKKAYTLPEAAIGLEFIFYVDDTDSLRIVASSGDGIKDTTNAYGCFSAIAGSLWIIAQSTSTWIVVSSTGTWTPY